MYMAITTGQIETEIAICDNINSDFRSNIQPFGLTIRHTTNRLPKHRLFGCHKLFIQAWVSGISPSANRHMRGLELVIHGIIGSAYVY